ncbi:MAG: 2,4-dichlorophenol 6-monooxygenase, partial [Pseudomonadota bacterium]
GRFTLLTGLGGEAWCDAAEEVARELGIEIMAHIVGPRQAYVDHTGDWARSREVGDSGCVLVRPDHHVCWRQDAMIDDPRAELGRVMSAVLARAA